MSEAEIHGYDQFKKLSSNFEAGSYVLFTGSVDDSGHSWCPDCVEADPVIEKVFAKFQQKLTKVFVGDRPTLVQKCGGWKSRDCPFRKDPSTMLMVIPTLIKWKSPQRLEGEQLTKEDLVEMMFDD